MSQLKNLITQIIEFGINPNVQSNDKFNVLKKLLVSLYFEYVNINFEFDESDFDEEPDFDYNEIKQNVKSNFPKLDWYSMVLDLNRMEPDVEIGIGDALDDLTDIIKDLMEVKWRMENTSEMDALWHFEYLMKIHSEQHLIDLLKYIKEKEYKE